MVQEFTLPSTLEILKKRWPEVVMIVGFQTGVLILLDHIMGLTQSMEVEGEQVIGQISPGLAFLMGLGTMAFLIIFEMLRLGFLRTAYTNGCASCEPGYLLRTGRYFFWRFFRYQILAGVVCFGLGLVVMSLVGAALFGAKTPEEIPKWLGTVSSFAASVAVVKYMTLMPAVMLGRDMTVRQSIVALREYRIAEAGRVTVLFVVSLGVVSAISIAVDYSGAEGWVHYVLVGFQGVMLSVALLAVYLEALRFVGDRERPIEVEGEESETGDGLEYRDE